MLKRLLLVPLLVLLASSAWAFPQNGVLDSFTGCVDNTTPPNSNWTNAVFIGASSSTVDCEDLAATSTTGATEADAYYNVTIFNANSEAYGKAATGFGSADELGVCVRLVNIGANTTDGYCVYLENTPNTLKIFRIDNGVGTLLGSGVSISPVAGDQAGISAIGSQICSWFKTAAGSFGAARECVTDATYSAGGRIGISIIGAAAVGTLDDFGGGNVSVSRGQPLFLE